MPRRNDLKRIMIVGSGPIVIGQACEFDYSGTQACKALKADGYEVVLINSNPATIMTDPELADRTYVEPLSIAYAEEVIKRERPDALLSTVGGQTGLNLSVALAEAGILEKYGVELIGAKIDAIKKAEDRLLFVEKALRRGRSGKAHRGQGDDRQSARQGPHDATHTQELDRAETINAGGGRRCEPLDAAPQALWPECDK